MRIAAVLLALLATPALAAEPGVPFLSLRNANFVILLAFLAFLGVLLYYRVPARVADMLDRRAEGIRAELGEARTLREEAQTLLASFERKRAEVAEQSRRIVTEAQTEARRAAEQAKEDAARAVARRLAAAEERIASAEARAVRAVRDRAVTVAIAAAQDVLARQMTPERGDRLIDDSIAAVAAKLH